jgi:DNA ligase 1
MSRSGIMLCYPFEEKRLAKWAPPYIVQPKLDGERCRYERFEGGSFLLSSQQNPIFGVPHIKSFLDSLGNIPHLDGELYCHGMHFENIHSIVSRERSYHTDYHEMQYHVFDIINGDRQPERLIELARYNSIFKMGPVRIVPFYIANNLDEVMRCYDKILNEGYEGIVLREYNNTYVTKRSTSMMKFKPKKTDEYEIVGYTQEVSIHGEPKQSLGAFVCKGDDGTLFNVGTGFTKSDREFLWSNAEYYIGKKVLVSYQHLTHGAGVPRFPVFTKVI